MTMQAFFDRRDAAVFAPQRFHLKGQHDQAAHAHGGGEGRFKLSEDELGAIPASRRGAWAEAEFNGDLASGAEAVQYNIQAELVQ